MLWYLIVNSPILRGNTKESSLKWKYIITDGIAEEKKSNLLRAHKYKQILTSGVLGRLNVCRINVHYNYI